MGLRGCKIKNTMSIRVSTTAVCSVANIVRVLAGLLDEYELSAPKRHQIRVRKQLASARLNVSFVNEMNKDSLSGQLL